ncbi:uncharacterized protein MYCFIDRAFT_161112 [Pseudocercospora fijiensis CIRAD86]|uniref:tripeptidyl-peptidase II n=1 Tax=Pseudocercospora fijiensis (strain CIRAD86) TaxID=383855 RepID=M2Z6N9_PSEFD|nr:uncharacterized protein MYCFIDRAFT_161112 [Pseudocercospora fijiensis CIRAD86]EME85440.1 hypothetical protein MYCFIDRAFT_161112 [Pseudocercospora fijiensis CIRAD86]
MLLTRVALSLSAIGIASGRPSAKRTSYAVKERHIVPRSWTKLGPASKQDTLQIAIGLKQQNEGLIEQHLMEVSDPEHQRYGQHLSYDEVNAIVAPSNETLEAVQSWLIDHGITDWVHNHAKDMIHCSMSVEKAESLLDTKYHAFKHADGTEINRAPEWSLPEYLHDHIDMVQPTTSFFHPQKELVDDDNPWKPLSYWQAQDKPGLFGEYETEKCKNNFVTPQCLRTVYGTINYKPQVPDRNGMATANYLNETAHRKDIETFMKAFRPDAAPIANTFQYVVIAGGANQQGDYTPDLISKDTNKEANMDAINAISIIYPSKFTAWSTGGSPPFQASVKNPKNTNEPYLVWLDYVLGQKDLPNVISTSYGDEEQTVPVSYAKRVCAGMAQLGVRGISVVFSSGDAGVGSSEGCVSNDGKNTRMFMPNFPTSCPWVTSVGATGGFSPEVAVTEFASGAGFSNYFPMPDYQNSTVQKYMQGLGNMHQGLYNPNGRAYPDVSAQGNHDVITWNGQTSTMGGTSASAPTFAAVITLVNDALIAAGKPPLGFMNTWLYSSGYQALTDITNGSSYGCGTKGFPATQGWDAVTGWGTPNFTKLVQAAMSAAGASTNSAHRNSPELQGAAQGGHR